jgi:uncharacterized protein YceK
MARRRVTHLMFVLSTLLCGCASYANILDDRDWKGGRVVYGGTLTDCGIIIATPRACFSKGDEYALFLQPIWTLGFGLLAAVDLPLSVIGDTLTLPITLNHALNSKTSDSPNLPGTPELPNSPSAP